jgi:predicted transcriptional regulator
VETAERDRVLKNMMLEIQNLKEENLSLRGEVDGLKTGEAHTRSLMYDFQEAEASFEELAVGFDRQLEDKNSQIECLK